MPQSVLLANSKVIGLTIKPAGVYFVVAGTYQEEYNATREVTADAIHLQV